MIDAFHAEYQKTEKWWISYGVVGWNCHGSLLLINAVTPRQACYLSGAVMNILSTAIMFFARLYIIYCFLRFRGHKYMSTDYIKQICLLVLPVDICTSTYSFKARDLQNLFMKHGK